jgi:hypothetical protein
VAELRYFCNRNVPATTLFVKLSHKETKMNSRLRNANFLLAFLKRESALRLRLSVSLGSTPKTSQPNELLSLKQRKKANPTRSSMENSYILGTSLEEMQRLDKQA